MQSAGKLVVVIAMTVMWMSRGCPVADSTRMHAVIKSNSSTKRQHGGYDETQNVCKMWEHARLKLRHSNSSVSISPIILPFPVLPPSRLARNGSSDSRLRRNRATRPHNVAIETVESGDEGEAGEEEERESGKGPVQVGGWKESPIMRKAWEETMHRHMATPSLGIPARRNGCRYFGGCNMSGACR
jgi:hypothetical protein